MTLRQVIVSDAVSVFLSTDDFAEDVVYTPALGNLRPIKAVIIRDGLVQNLKDDSDSASIEVHVANSDTVGIASYDINCGRDKLTFSDRPGEAPTVHTIQRLLSHDEGMLVLECR